MDKLEDNPAHVVHYAFAHRHLKEMTFEEPSLLLGAASEGRLPHILNKIWNDMNSKVPEGQRHVGEIHVEINRLIDGVIILVVMPEPRTPPEASYVAIVFQNTPQEELVTQFFTLELSYDNTYAMGVWTPDGKHGIISREKKNLEEFMEKVVDIVIGLPDELEGQSQA